ncbi:MAG TPA: glycosyltransferase family 39 protein [Usitatibacter sp.]|jgi:4-amino-4-deoxy-L-arabinose transferase-like glycosyltransferase|nr:glycosyltransferase family 39 protein [Usitatibacter sp.]
MTLRAARWLLVLLALVAFAVGVDNMSRPLANPDEGRYSEISREMSITGDWVTPRLDGIKYFEKPPLQYWATALAFEAFGYNEYAARLYVWLCAIATLGIAAYTAMRLATVEAGIATALVLAGSPYFLALGGIVTLDMGVTLWTTLTVCAFLLAEHAHAERRASAARNWMLVAWAAMALAVLSKGLIGIVFAGAAVFFQVVLSRDLSALRRMRWLPGLALFAVIAVPWFVLVSRANPEFARFFFVHEHFERFLTHEHHRVQPWWFFLPIVVLAFLPWAPALPAAVRHAWRAERGADLQPMRVALLWAAFIVFFFSASGSKLPAYILPAIPLLALPLGRYLAEAPAARLARYAAFTVPIGLVLFVAAYVTPGTSQEPWVRELNLAAQPFAYAAAAAFTAGALAGAWLLRAGRRWTALAVVALANVLMVGGLIEGYRMFSPRQSDQEAARLMGAYLRPSTRLYSVKIYDQSLPFYLGRTLKLVSYVDEFETGLKAEPGIGLDHLEDFPAEWLRPGDALAIIQPGVFEELQRQGLPMEVIHQDAKRVLVRKP